MGKAMVRGLLLAFASLAAIGAAAEGARVDSVQAPAWLERSGRSVPLATGVELQAGDKVVTGGNARTRLLLSEGSAVRLGENATFTFERIEHRGVFRAALNVLEGAFRFTTALANRARPRDVSIKVK